MVACKSIYSIIVMHQGVYSLVGGGDSDYCFEFFQANKNWPNMVVIQLVANGMAWC